MKKPYKIAALVLAAAAAGYAKPGPHDSVEYAPSWEAAVAEAKLLNLPLVVHCHGFN
jgi:hypothetical protein